MESANRDDPIVAIEPLAVRPRTAAKMLDCGQTKIYELIKLGKLETIRLDSDQRITIASIKRLAGGDKTAA